MLDSIWTKNKQVQQALSTTEETAVNEQYISNWISIIYVRVLWKLYRPPIPITSILVSLFSIQLCKKCISYRKIMKHISLIITIKHWTPPTHFRDSLLIFDWKHTCGCLGLRMSWRCGWRGQDSCTWNSEKTKFNKSQAPSWGTLKNLKIVHVQK